MFAGPTASEFAQRARIAPDNPPLFHPEAGDLMECEGSHDGIAVFAKHQRVVYGVGCKPDFVQYLCDACYEQNSEGSADDEFWCEGCDEPHATNTSWELHYADVDSHVLCLKCAAEHVRTKPGFWITRPTQVNEARVRKAPHFIPELFDDLVEIDGDTADSMSGATVVTTSDTEGSFRDFVLRIRHIAERALETYPRVAIVMTNQWQFAVYIAVIAEREVA